MTSPAIPKGAIPCSYPSDVCERDYHFKSTECRGLLLRRSPGTSEVTGAPTGAPPLDASSLTKDSTVALDDLRNPSEDMIGMVKDSLSDNISANVAMELPHLSAQRQAEIAAQFRFDDTDDAIKRGFRHTAEFYQGEIDNYLTPPEDMDSLRNPKMDDVIESFYFGGPDSERMYGNFDDIVSAHRDEDVRAWRDKAGPDKRALFDTVREVYQSDTPRGRVKRTEIADFVIGRVDPGDEEAVTKRLWNSFAGGSTAKIAAEKYMERRRREHDALASSAR